jgi:hypothetical protein
MRTNGDRRRGGSVLLLAVILLMIITVLGIGVLTMSTKERAGALTKSRYDRLVACAHAAQAKIWADVAIYGTGYLAGPTGVTAITLPDGSALAAPAHYDTAVDGSVAIKDVALSIPGGAGGGSGTVDRTNRGPVMFGGGAGGSIGGAPLRMVARCTDAFGRTFEVELGVRFAL